MFTLWSLTRVVPLVGAVVFGDPPAGTFAHTLTNTRITTRANTVADTTASPLVSPLVATRDSAKYGDSLPPAMRAIVDRLRPVNPRLAALRAQASAAVARRSATGFSPPLTLSGEIEEMPGADVTRAGALRVGVQRALGAGPQRRAERAVADADVTRVRAALSVGELALTTRVVSLIETIIGNATIAERLAAKARLLDDVGESLTNRFAVGDARYVDVLRLRTERLRVMNERALATSAVRTARAALLGLAGTQDRVVRDVTALLDRLITTRLATRDASTNASTGTSPGAPTLATVDTSELALPAVPDVEQAVLISAAVRTADADVARNEALSALGTALRRPQVTASLGLQRFGDVGTTQRNRQYGLTLGGSLTLPFTARTAHQRAARADAAHVLAADATANATRADVRTQLTVARERYAAARTRAAEYDLTLLRGAREERASALASYRAGTMTLLELLDFERALVQAEVGRIDARLDAVRAYATFAAIIADPTVFSSFRDDDTTDADFDAGN